MPNLMNEVLNSSSTLTTIRQIRSDAAQVYTSVVKGAQSAENTVSNMMRNNQLLRRVQDWFRGSSDSLQSSLDDLSDTEFDTNDDPEHSSSVLDSSSYKQVSHAKMDAMYQIASKQINAKLHTTAQIISVVDHRSSEIVSGLNHADELTRKISAQLDQLIKLQTVSLQRQTHRARADILGSSGELNIQNFLNIYKAKQTSLTQQALDYLKTKTRLGEIDQAVSDKITDFQNKFFKAILNIPWIRDRFNPFGRASGNRDYSVFVKNEYTTDPAVFDNITRTTIVDIIPDYLRHITNALTGNTYYVSDEGNLTQTKPHGFERIVEVSFDASMISDKSVNQVTSNAEHRVQDIPRSDVLEVQRLLLSQYIYRAYKLGERIVGSKFFRAGGDQAVHRHVAQLLVKAKGRTINKWMKVINIITSEWITNPRYAEEFSRSVIRGYKQLDARAQAYAENSRGFERLAFTQEMFDQQFMNRASFGSARFEHEGKTLRELIRDKIIKKSQLTAEQLADLDKPLESYSDLRTKIERHVDFDDLSSKLGGLTKHFSYLDSIYEILNRGINVYSRYGGKNGLESMNPQEKKPDQQPDEKPQVQDDVPAPIEQKPTAQSSEPAPVHDLIPAPLKRAVSKITDTVSSIISPANDDQEKTTEVMAGMTAVIRSGEVSESDQAELTEKTSTIQNPTLREKIKSTISGVFSRNGEKKKPKTFFGKALLFVFGIAKIFFSKIFSAGSSFITKSVSWFVKSLKSSLDKIRTGARSIREGFKGSEESIGLFARIKNLIPKRKKKKTKKKKIVEEDDIEETTTDESSEEEELDEEEMDVVEEMVEEDQKNQKADSKKGGIFSSLADRIKKSQFAQGFSDAMGKKTKSAVPQSVEDESSNQILQMLKPSGGNSMLDMCGDKLDTIKTSAREWIDQEILKLNPDADDNKKPDQKKKDDNKDKDTKKDTKPKGLGYDLGKIFGGATKIFLGIGQAMMTVIAGMSGFKAITSLLKGVLEKSLKPLNRAFHTLVKALRPTVKTIQKVLTEIVQYVVQIVESVVVIIQPILDAIGPIIDQLLEVLTPILDMITQLLNVLMVPLVAIMQSVVVPILQSIANVFEILLGVTQVGMGLILSAIGAVIKGVGTLVKFFTHDSSMADTGDQMLTMGTNMISTGANSVVSGFKKQLSLVVNTVKGVATGEAIKTVATAARETSQEFKTPTGSAMDGIYGSGDYDMPYAFDDDVQDALSTLKSLTSQIIQMFMPEEDSTEELLDAETARYNSDQLKLDVSSLSEDEQAALEQAAYEMFQNENPQYEGETDAEYQARYEQNRTRYWEMAATKAVADKVKATAGGSDGGAISLINSALGEIDPTTGKRKGGGIMDNFAQDVLSSANAASNKSGFTVESLLGQDSSTYTGGSYGTTSGYDKEDLIRSAAMVYEGYIKANPNGTYIQGMAPETIHLRDGTSRHVRPDCSGMVSAAIQTMGYRIGKDNGEWGKSSSDFAGANTNTFIYDQDGNLSSDWQVLPFSSSALQRGDITAKYGHVSLPIDDLQASWPKGLDAGGTANIQESARAAIAYLNGESNIPWRTAMGPKWDNSGGATKIWRYVGKPKTSGTQGSYTVSRDTNGTTTPEQVYRILTQNYGMSPIGAAGLMGCFHYESNMQTNNLENVFENRFGTTDKQYTAAVDSGAESERQFVTGRNATYMSHQTPGEAVGYGIAQFTSSNLKQSLYNNTVKQGKSISDPNVQLGEIVNTLRSRGILDTINNAASPTAANQQFLWKYEAGTSYTSDAAVLDAYSWMNTRTDGYANAVLARHGKAEEFYRTYAGGDDLSPYIDTIYGDSANAIRPIKLLPNYKRHTEIPEIDYSKFEDDEQTQPIIINNYESDDLSSLSDYIDEILVTDYDIEATEIRKLVEDIFEEFPEYIEDDDEDSEFSEMDDYIIQRLAAAFM